MEEAGAMKVLDNDRFPWLYEWAQKFNEIPLIKECLPPRNTLLEYFNASISYMRSLATNKPWNHIPLAAKEMEVEKLKLVGFSSFSFRFP